jgi:hypothetical protein
VSPSSLRTRPVAEVRRREDPEWRRWGPYVSERAWGTVREDYSADGDAWSYFPHDHARSRAFRWSEDGLGGNWRGPIWFPVNFVVIGALERFAQRLGDGLTVEFPRGSGRDLSLSEIASELAGRLVEIFLADAGGRRPVFGDRLDPDLTWRDALLFHEYFDGDDGRGLGASHQTGWSGLVADMVIRLSRARTPREP